MKQYLDIVKKVLNEGRWKKNRTGIDTLAIPGCLFEHDMADGFPLLTTKHVPFGLVASELEFFIKGMTDKKWLEDRKNFIWSEWCSPSIIKDDGTPETRAKMKAERELGPIYGWQWRHFGAHYLPLSNRLGGPERADGLTSDKFDPELGYQGVDQLKNLVETLKRDPNNRRLVVSAWNPKDLGSMALPACHYGFQVTHIDGILSLEFSMRSSDVFLGLPFNIASYGLLLELLSVEAGLTPGKLIGFLADTHIYENHMDQVKEQLSREARPLPMLTIDRGDKAPWSIFDWVYTEARVSGYSPHPKIKAPVAI